MAEQTGQAMIEAQGLSKFYGNFAAATDVTFTVPRGQVCAFLGPNGAGKSTTMKMLSGFRRHERIPRQFTRGLFSWGLSKPRKPRGETVNTICWDSSIRISVSMITCLGGGRALLILACWLLSMLISTGMRFRAT